MKEFKENTLKNKQHYDEVYSRVNIQSILDKLDNLNDFIN